MTTIRGRFNDGRTAVSRDVLVTPAEGALRIADPDGDLLALWPSGDLVRLDAGEDSALVLRREPDDGARLTLPDHALLAEIPRPRGGPRGAAGRFLRGFGLSVLATAAVLLLLAVLWQLLPAAARWTAAAVPPAWEERIGERAYGQILGILARFSEAPPRICADPKGLAALETLTRRLAGAVGPSAYDFRPVVLDLEIVNALALPGGRILLFGGLIEKAESSAEVAGVLAHEMGHVIRRHGTESIVRSVGVSVVFDLLLGGSGSLPSALGETLVRASYSREAETEADRTALALLEAAGIRAEGLVRFFERLHETDGELPPGFNLLSSHPRSDARAELFARVEGGGPALSEADWQSLKGICGAQAE